MKYDANDICDECDFVEGISTYFEEKNDQFFIIKNVPTLKCKVCGEKAYGVMTLTKIEKFIMNCKEDKEVILVDYNDVLKTELKDFAVA